MNMDRYTETINTLMGSLHLDDMLCSHILDILSRGLLRLGRGIGLRGNMVILRGVILMGIARVFPIVRAVWVLFQISLQKIQQRCRLC